MERYRSRPPDRPPATAGYVHMEFEDLEGAGPRDLGSEQPHRGEFASSTPAPAGSKTAKSILARIQRLEVRTFDTFVPDSVERCSANRVLLHLVSAEIVSSSAPAGYCSALDEVGAEEEVVHMKLPSSRIEQG